MSDERELLAEEITALRGDLDTALARVAQLEAALGETVRVLTFAFEEGALPEEVVLSLCIDPYGILADARAALQREPSDGK